MYRLDLKAGDLDPHRFVKFPKASEALALMELPNIPGYGDRATPFQAPFALVCKACHGGQVRVPSQGARFHLSSLIRHELPPSSFVSARVASMKQLMSGVRALKVYSGLSDEQLGRTEGARREVPPEFSLWIAFVGGLSLSAECLNQLSSMKRRRKEMAP